MDNNINEIVSSAIDKIKNILDVNTVVGVPFESKNGMIIIPLTKVSVGFVAGGGEYKAGQNDVKNTKCFPLAGGTGAGVCMNPIGFLTIKNQECKLIRIDEKSAYEKALETLPKVISNLTPIFKKEDKNEKNE